MGWFWDASGTLLGRVWFGSSLQAGLHVTSHTWDTSEYLRAHCEWVHGQAARVHVGPEEGDFTQASRI